MNRRTAIRNFLLVSAGVVLLPACARKKGQASIALKNIDLDSDDEALLADCCETLIPATDTPGAKDIGAHLFVMHMLDDCYTHSDQQTIVKGLAAFRKMAEEKYNRPFTGCTPQQRAELLLSIEKNKQAPAEVSAFYAAVKALTIEAYTTSKYYLTTVRLYELVPGRYHGCVPISTLPQRRTI